MSQPESSTLSMSGLITPSLIVLFGGLLAYFVHDTSLESRRPDYDESQLPPPPSIKHLEAVHSRLWNDPLLVATDDAKTFRINQPLISWLSKSINKNVPVVSGGNEDVKRMFAGLIKNWLKDTTDKRLLCLPILVPGEPYDYDTERRRRSTFAVLSGLTTCGYKLSQPDRISYAELDLKIQPPFGNEDIPKQCVVPIKAFERNPVESNDPGASTPNHVLVFWINEEQLGSRPIDAISQILEGCLGATRDFTCLEVRILGPSTSDVLIDMAREDTSWPQRPSQRGYIDPNTNQCRYFACGNSSRRAALYVCSATIAPDSLQGTDRSQLTDFLTATTTRSGLNVVRSIGTDAELCRELKHELQLRNAWPNNCASPSRTPSVVLVTEQDTYYGRSMERSFKSTFAEEKCPDVDMSRHLKHFTYLRGLDGKVPRQNKRHDSNWDKNQNADSEQDLARITDPDSGVASGTSQFDYLRRLKEELIRIDRENRNSGEPGISAIGVIGTDIFDKLLILRALRRSFPRVWFFTTDLDASMALKSEYPYTHNLIVASHFGLSLNDKFQSHAAPFRDVYETSTYFSTLLALDGFYQPQCAPWKATSDSSDSTLKPFLPRVFEIGRGGPYPLTIQSPTNPEFDWNAWHPSTSKEGNAHWLANSHHASDLTLLAVIGVIAWLYLSAEFRQVFKSAVWGSSYDYSQHWTHGHLVFVLVAIIGLAILITLAVVDHGRIDGEPFVVFQGISIWPPTIMRYIVVLFCVLSLAFQTRNYPELLRTNLSDALGTTLTSEKPSQHCGNTYHDFCNRDGWEKQGWSVVAPKWLCRSLSFSQAASWSLLAVGMLAFNWIFLGITELPFMPYRGDWSRVCSSWTLTAAVVCIAALNALVIVRIESCQKFVNRLSLQSADWNLEEMGKFATLRQPLQPSDLSEVLTVCLIAESSRMAGAAIKYPLIAMFGMILSKHPYFEMVEISWQLASCWGIMIGLLIWEAHALRKVAHEARSRILVRLRSRLSALIGHKDEGHARCANQLKQYMAEIQQENKGAFQPLANDPLIQSLAFLTSGGLVLIQHLFDPT